jgi:sugar transferase (PEP-CTERM/EpsH1 system associated)
MKLFVILSRVPYPLEKGDKLRAYHQLKELNKRHQVTLCCLSDVSINEDAKESLKEIADTFYIFRLKRWRTLFNLFFALFSRKPFQVMYFYQKPVHRAIRKLIDQVKPDHIYCQLIRTAEYAKSEHNYPKTLDYQDAFSKGIQRREEKASWPLRDIFTMEKNRLIAYENIIFEYFEACTIISDEDRRFIYHPERKDIAIISNGIDTDYFKPREAAEKKYDLVFIGNMSYPPNIETAEFIVNQVLPALSLTVKPIKLLLAGSSPHKRVKKLGQNQGVTVSGWIDDIREAYAAGTIFFAPMQIGTGLQNKLLEAMSMGLPCITSELASRSIRAEVDKELLVGNSLQDYTALIGKLLKSEHYRDEIGRSGREFVKNRFSWQESVFQLEKLMAAQSE